MSSLCSYYGNCDVSTVLSIGQIIGIVVGCLLGVAGVIATILIVVWLYKRSKRQRTVLVQAPVSQANAGFTQTMQTSYQGPYGQAMQPPMQPYMHQQDSHITPPQKI